jgi:hypothetical protein
MYEALDSRKNTVEKKDFLLKTIENCWSKIKFANVHGKLNGEQNLKKWKKLNNKYC